MKLIRSFFIRFNFLAVIHFKLVIFHSYNQIVSYDQILVLLGASRGLSFQTAAKKLSLLAKISTNAKNSRKNKIAVIRAKP